MKNLKYFLVIVVLAVLVFFVINKKSGTTPVGNGDDTKSPIELCFARFGQPGTNGFYDRYTLRMLLDRGKVTGELRFLPAEKDSKVGKFEGVVSTVDKVMMARTADVWWIASAEGMQVKEQLRIIFGEGTANVGFGEMVDRGDGVYVYKDPEKISYTLDLTDVSCVDLTERENVEKYLKSNVSTLSPAKAVLGGTWYVLSYTVDVGSNSGTVTYEDGHIQEKRDFSYTIDENLEVQSLMIK